MGMMASQITGVSNVYSNFCLGPDQRNHHSSASLVFVRGIQQLPVNSPHKGPVTRKNASIWWRHHDRCSIHWWHQKFNRVIFFRMTQRLRHIWLAMLAITAMIAIFMNRKNIKLNVQKIKYNMTSNDMIKIMQSRKLRDNGGLYRNVSAQELSLKNEAILTLFATFKDCYNKSYIHKNTIRNWGLLSPDVIPVLFTDMNGSSSVVEYARQKKWHIFPIPEKGTSGIPILRYMFLEAQQLFDTPFYGYANGDILFDKSLPDTIHGLIRLKKNLTNILVVGQRKNWKIKWQQSVTGLEEVGEYAESAGLFKASAQDYFISTRNGYPWSTIPDFVVGRTGYDNWLVVTALTKQIPLVDATRTIMALHQTDAKGVTEGANATVDKTVNKQLAGGNFSYILGKTFCAHFVTSKDNGVITIKEGKNGKTCKNQTVPHIRSPFQLSWHVDDWFSLLLIHNMNWNTNTVVLKTVVLPRHLTNFIFRSLRWRYNGRDCVSNHQPHNCLLNRLFGRRSK